MTKQDKYFLRDVIVWDPLHPSISANNPELISVRYEEGCRLVCAMKKAADFL